MANVVKFKPNRDLSRVLKFQRGILQEKFDAQDADGIAARYCIIDALIQLANPYLTPKERAMYHKIIVDATHVKPAQRLEMTGRDGRPMEMSFTLAITEANDGDSDPA